MPISNATTCDAVHSFVLFFRADLPEDFLRKSIEQANFPEGKLKFRSIGFNLAVLAVVKADTLAEASLLVSELLHSALGGKVWCLCCDVCDEPLEAVNGGYACRAHGPLIFPLPESSLLDFPMQVSTNRPRMSRHGAKSRTPERRQASSRRDLEKWVASGVAMNSKPLRTKSMPQEYLEDYSAALSVLEEMQSSLNLL